MPSISIESLPFLLILLSILWTIIILNLTSNYFRPRKSSKLPPGPFQFPIIGNILHLGTEPHRSLAKLSQKYGPVMSLKLGSITTIIISSPEAAKNVLQKHDSIFSSRTIPTCGQVLNHHKFSMLWLPVENQWQKLRKICKEQMLSVQRLGTSQGLRREKLQKLCDYVRECSETGRAVDIGDAVFTTMLNLLSAMIFSIEFAQFNSDTSHEMKDIVCGAMTCQGTPNFADYFPILKEIDPQGILRKAKKLKSRSDQKNHDFLEALIKINQRDEAELSINEIKHLLLDLFLAGSDTTSTTVEWAMVELLRNPDKMSRVRNEINDLVGENNHIQESDISRLPYLQAVVKESLRFHSTAPILPHRAEVDVEINDYIIPKNAQVLVNLWAIGRDPNVWPNADSFIPERFLDKNYDQINFTGKDFELIPFGAGRRICPGLPLAYRMIHLMLATLVHKFSWELEGTKPEEMDMNEIFGLSLQKAVPVRAIPTKL